MPIGTIASALGLTIGETISATGLLLDIAGVYLLSISGILGDRPFRTFYHLKRNVDKENLSEGGEVAMQTTSTDNRMNPQSKRNYNEYLREAGKQSAGTVFLMVGFSLQFIGTVA